MASGNTITLYSDATIPLSNKLSQKVQHTFLFENLKTGSLVSIRKLCDNDFITIFTKYQLKIFFNNTIIIIGKHNVNSLWDIPLTSEPSSPPKILNMSQVNSISQIRTRTPTPPPFIINKHQTNGDLRNQKTKQELAKYLFSTLFNPCPSTFMRAITYNSLLTFSGLTTKLISKHLPESEASFKGHLAQE